MKNDNRLNILFQIIYSFKPVKGILKLTNQIVSKNHL